MHEATIANGPITNWLAIVGVVSLIYWGWRIAAALLSRGREKGGPIQKSPTAVAAPAAPAPTHENDIAVIAAAVYAVLGAHRIVHLEAEAQDKNWVSEGRWMHQTSHRTRA